MSAPTDPLVIAERAYLTSRASGYSRELSEQRAFEVSGYRMGRAKLDRMEREETWRQKRYQP